MIKLVDILQEIGDAQSKPYEWKTTVERDDAIKYEFTTEKGTEYEVTIDAETLNDKQDANGMGVSFKPKNTEKYTSTNEGNQYRIMATVKEIMQSYMKAFDTPNAQPIDFIYFYPEKEKGEQDNRRARFYIAYIKRLLPTWEIKAINNKIYATREKDLLPYATDMKN